MAYLGHINSVGIVKVYRRDPSSCLWDELVRRMPEARARRWVAHYNGLYFKGQ